MYEIVLDKNTSPSDVKGFFRKLFGHVIKFRDNAKYYSAKYVFEEVVDRTPVFTGWARASWSAGVNDAPLKSIPKPQPIAGQFAPPTFDAPRRVHNRDEYVIINDAPHILVLNAGHSQQAPALFIETAIDVGLARAMANVKMK